MITVKSTDFLFCKMSEIAEIAKDKSVFIPTHMVKQRSYIDEIENPELGETASQWLAEKATHFRYSFNPKKTFSPHSLLYSGESAINPVHCGNDRDEIAYVIVDNNA